MRQEEQSEEAESCHGNLWNEIQLKEPYREKQTRKQQKKKWVSSVGLYVKKIYYKQNKQTKQSFYYINIITMWENRWYKRFPSIGGQHHESNNLEGRIQFMIVKINILGLMSPNRRLIILRVSEIKTVRTLYCKAKLPYLNIYLMIILPVEEFMILLVWALDADVCAIKTTHPVTLGIAVMT